MLAAQAKPKPQLKPNVAALVKSALGEGIVPYAAVRPIFADFNGDGQDDLAVVVDFNKYLQAWLKRGVAIQSLDSPSLAPMHPDNEQHFCFGLLILDHMLPSKKMIFYGCFTGWRLAKSSTPAIDLDMESGETLRLFNDGTKFRTRVVRKN
ncbi:MAG TPA: hypothetical protein VHA14_19415 [Bryobacteraceae bacterium]|nr:hypothetical protein [Bryobacteraceae bacterium]